MTGVKDSDTIKILGFPQGLDNLSAEEQVPIGRARSDGKLQGALRIAQNIDIDEAGKVSRRDGFSLVSALPGIHSVWASPDFALMLAVYGTNLVCFDSQMVMATITALTSAPEPMSYDTIAGQVYYSNGFDSGRVSEAKVRQDWAIMPPINPPVLAVSASGGLQAGTYQVAVTFLDAAGRESGSSLIEQIELLTGQGIALTAMPTTTDPAVTTVRVYCSETNGQLLYAVQDMAEGTPTFLLGVHVSGKALDTEFDEPLPPGHIVRFHNGHQLIARGKELYWSNPLHPGQARLQSNYLSFGARVDLVESVGQGGQAVLYVAAGDRTYAMSGATPKEWARRISHPHGAVAGSSTKIDPTYMGLEAGSRLPYWLDKSGQFVYASQAGVQAIHAERYAAETGVSRAATVLHQAGGSRRLISVLQGGDPNGLAIGDRVETEVWKDGVRIS